MAETDIPITKKEPGAVKKWADGVIKWIYERGNENQKKREKAAQEEIYEEFPGLKERMEAEKAKQVPPKEQSSVIPPPPGVPMEVVKAINAEQERNRMAENNKALEQATPAPSAPISPPVPSTEPTAKMSRAEEAGAKVEQGIIENIAILAKENFNALYIQAYQISGEKLQPPKDDDGYLKLSRELIEKRQLTLTNEKGEPITITLNQVDDYEEMQAKKAAEVFNRKFDSTTPKFSSRIPTMAQVQSTSKAVADGVEENTGGLFGLFDASLSNIFAGLLAWLSDGLKGGLGGLFEKIRETTANNTVESVKNNLSAADTGLGVEQRAEILGKVKDKVDEAAEVKGRKTPTPSKKLSDVKAPDLSELSALGATLGTLPAAPITPELERKEAAPTAPSTPELERKGAPPAAPGTPELERKEAAPTAPPKTLKQKYPQKSASPPALGQTPTPKSEDILLTPAAPVDSRLKDSATAITTQIMRNLGNKESPDQNTIGVITRVLEDNKSLLEEKKYKDLSGKLVEALLRNPETVKVLKIAAEKKLKDEYDEIDKEKTDGFFAKGSRLTRLGEKKGEMGLYAAAPESTIKLKLPGIITPILENGAGQILLDSMKPKPQQVSSLSGLVNKDDEPNLVVANIVNRPEQFIPQSGSTIGTGLNAAR